MRTLRLLLTLSFFQTSVDCHASVMVIPNRSQFLEYEKILVRCEGSSSWEWTPWRNSTGLMKCGAGWGKKNSSTCEIASVKRSEGGVYWCQSKYGDSSNSVKITIAGGSVSLHSPAIPVTEGDNVTLICETNIVNPQSAQFYKDGFLLGEAAGHMTLYNFTKSNEGAYKCNIGRNESPESWITMEDGSDRASLVVSPASSQVFEYRNLSLSCGDNSSVDGWRLFRSTSTTVSTSPTGAITVNLGGKRSACGDDWGNVTSSGCNVFTSKLADSAVYWCESPVGQRSNTLNISIIETAVILESPVLAVMEGDNVTLSCKTKDHEDLRADFYKDGYSIGMGADGNLTLHDVSSYDEGVYKCSISGEGESAISFLFVRGASAPRSDRVRLVLTVLRHLVVFSPYCASTLLMVSIYRRSPPGRRRPVAVTTSPPSEEADDITTEHRF
ncbi:hypothetical protein PBY51_005713 [Eleginops maclovinus]|uniref:Ig-like domain-containing protein n=1 Tax=Eleginops maclovinus TaxID=56733 RepID=A0AAN7WRW0_ELEMC|nr:hypothetical protein PBY51_005713 [Eleginops maclovinus]